MAQDIEHPILSAVVAWKRVATLGHRETRVAQPHEHWRVLLDAAIILRPHQVVRPLAAV